jgi:hypothetical protein
MNSNSITNNLIMIYNKDNLLQEIQPMWSQIAREVPKKTMKIGIPKVEAERGARAYENAFNSFLPFVILGDATIREEETLIQNMGTLATDPQVNQKKISDFLEESLKLENKNKQLKSAVKVHTTQGALLNDSNWWPFRNDMFMLGSIHSGKEFHLAFKNGKEPSDDSLWDNANKRPRVLGRELIMLALAGYKKVEKGQISACVNPIDLEQVYVLPKNYRASELTLTVCRKKFAEITSAADIRNLFQ